MENHDALATQEPATQPTTDQQHADGGSEQNTTTATPHEDTSGTQDPRASETIDIKVNYEGCEMFFKLKRSTPLKKLMTVFCKRQGVDPQHVRFVFDGRRLAGQETASSLDMENDDTIDVLVQQTGGTLQ
jgi:hypothetical protein